MSIRAPPPAKPAALTPARPEQPPPPTPDTAANAAVEKKDFATLTSRTVAGPNGPSRAAGGARARDAKSMPKATGRWTAEEHDEFLKCLDIYGREWKKVAERITTRTAAQIRSHAQKYFKKIEAAGEGAPKAAKPPVAGPAPDGAPQIPAETLAGALGALDDMLRALRSKRARYEDDQTPSEAASDASDAPPVEKRPRAASEGHVIPQAKRSRANSDDRAPGLRRRVTCDDLRALEALELLREAAGGAF
jgi:SHAQKYF class myb-like DNA-binding protein